MSAATIGVLIGLALVDSLSFGTLVIPLWLLTAPGRLRIARVGVYLGTVAVAYFAIGVALQLGASSLAGSFDRARETPAFLVAQLAAGIALLVVSQSMDGRRARERARARLERGDGPLVGWRRRIMADDGGRGASTAALIGLAATAVAVEAASMLPYVSAIGIITAEQLSWPAPALVLAAYCAVMIAPAIILTVARALAHDLVDGPLRRCEAWFTRHARSTTAWIIGIVGFLLAASAVSELGWFGA